ncbi:hypothetical protein GGS23DRAFT_610601 [Durotheca rogersii]|uniref:uncharacterized protein n=1 Tax=Durotheca rogersii TaxID=419775 RepID=UPI002220EF88|nr:uncharacterized protein GGS23DRAFT_610601 [Durotheca rogersii]KAI5862419.1 hypothetical protein GGS23DRAFT_610601 [Durotheca rogersii]
MQLVYTALMALMAAGSAMAHMNMADPPPLAYKGNPNAKEPNIDYSITSPISAAEYPCKGYLKLLGTPEAAPVKTYAPGGQYTMSVEGGAFHNGGSCQLSLSYDKGASFTVIKSFVGNCPTASGGTYSFTVPDDAPEGDEVVFAWTWVNNTGNREFYMSCAVVSIKGGAAKRADSSVKRAVAFANRPPVFQANLGGEFCTREGIDTVFPNPGPDVENNSSKTGPAIFCATGADAPVGSGSDTPAETPAEPETSAVPETPVEAPAQTEAPVSTSAAPAIPTIVSAPAASAAPGPDVLTVIPIDSPPLTASSSTGGVFLTVDPSAPATTATATPAAPSSASPAVPSSAAPAQPSAEPEDPACEADETEDPACDAEEPAPPASSSVVAAPPSTPTSTRPAAPIGTGVAGAVQSGPCSNEGDWACAPDGSSFQRCASGLWSVPISMAAGTKCAPGISKNLSIRGRGGFRRSL